MSAGDKLFVTGLVLFLVVVVVIMSVTVIRSNRALVRSVEHIRDEGLAAYVSIEHEETARLIAETRAATAKMDAVAQALWDGLQGTVRA